jgi:hypothetical protein
VSNNRLSRRQFLKLAGMSAAGVLSSGLMPVGRHFAPNQAAAMPMEPEPFMPDAEVWLAAKETGAQTRVWGYEGQLLSGSGVTVQACPAATWVRSCG